MPIIGIIASSKLKGGGPYGNPPVTSGLTHWYDGADATTMTVSGGNISQWNNKSPASGGPNITQGTGSRQPDLVSNVKFGRSAVNFVRANTDHLGAGVQPTTGSSPCSVVAVFQGTAVANNTGIVVTSWGNFNATGAGYSLTMRPTGDANANKIASGYAGSFDDWYVNSTSTYGGTWVCAIETINNTALTQIINNTDSTTKTTVGAANVANRGEFWVGQLGDPWYSTGGWAGYIGDLLIYNRVLTTQERTDMYNWAKAKWDL